MKHATIIPLLAYALFGLSWLETARIAGLYGVELPPRRVRRSDKTGFPGFLHTIWLQLIDPGSWRALANFAISTVLGWAALSPVSSRCVYGGVAELSIYIAAEARGQGVGRQLFGI